MSHSPDVGQKRQREDDDNVFAFSLPILTRPGMKGLPPRQLKPIPRYLQINDAIMQLRESKSSDTAANILEVILRPEDAPFLNAVNLATAMVGISQAVDSYEYLPTNFGKLMMLVIDYAPHFPARNVANTLQAMAKLHYKNHRALAALSARACIVISEFEPQCLANSLWALATLEYRDNMALHHLTREVCEKVRYFNEQNIANSLWALAKLAYQDNALAIIELISAARDKASSLNPQNITNSLYAIAKLSPKYQDQGAIAALISAAYHKVSAFNAQNTANTLWSMATLEAHRSEPAIAALVRHTTTLAPTLNEQNTANILWAMAKLRYRDEEALAALMREVRNKISTFNTQEISNILCAMAKLNYRDEASLTALLEQAWLTISRFRVQDITNTLWAMACLGEKERLQDFIKGIIFRVDLAAADFQKENVLQMHYVRLYCQLILKIPLPYFLDGLVVTVDMLEATGSGLQLEVTNAIKDLGVHHGYSVLDEAILNGISVDMLIKPHNIVVEVDGPFHFVRNADHKLSYHGPSQLKDLLLNAMGYRVLHVTQAEWLSHTTAEAKKAYLSSALSAQLSSTPASSIPFLHLRELRARKAEASMPSPAAPL